MEFNELMQTFVNKDYDELLTLAKEAMARVLPICKVVDEENNGMAMLTSILLSAIAADGKLTGLEAKFLSDLTGLDAAGVDKLTDLYSDKMEDLTDVLADKIPTEQKADMLVLITSLAACDETISRDETALIRKIMA